MFKDELAGRGWMLKPGNTSRQQPPPTHLFLDNGRAAVPDEFAGTFLNMYANAIIKGQRVCAVELKTSTFKLFFDVDIHVADSTEDMMSNFMIIHAEIPKFWALETPAKMVVCAAPPKACNDGTTKLGFHIYWPDIYVNAPIAMAFRAHLLDGCLPSEWADILDPCVFKQNGLRMVFSEKGGSESRPYTPTVIVTGEEVHPIGPKLSAQQVRSFVHDLSLRVFDGSLTPCLNGIDQLANDQKFGAVSNSVAGNSVRLESLSEVLPDIQALLPDVYKTQRFTGVYRTEHCIMLKSSSRYCNNINGEHRTSTVYFAVSRRGLTQRCFCRKDERGCSAFSSENIDVPASLLDILFPTDEQKDLESAQLHVMPSKKCIGSGDLHALLMRSCQAQPKPKNKKQKKPRKK